MTQELKVSTGRSSMKLRWYWFIFDGLPVTFHLSRDYDVRWTHIRGIGIGHWFFGAVRSDDIARVLEEQDGTGPSPEAPRP